MKFDKKRRSMSSLDALLKATATGTEQANVIDKALNTPIDRIMKSQMHFEKADTIKPTDPKDIVDYTVLKPELETELAAARRLKQLGVKVQPRGCHVDPIPQAYMKCRKILRKA